MSTPTVQKRSPTVNSCDGNIDGRSLALAALREHCALVDVMGTALREPRGNDGASCPPDGGDPAQVLRFVARDAVRLVWLSRYLQGLWKGCDSNLLAKLNEALGEEGGSQ